MGKGFTLTLGILIICSPAWGQTRTPAIRRRPVLELSGGYAFTRLNTSPVAENTNGIDGSLGINITPWFQMVADASVTYGSVTGANIKIYGNHFGPRIFLRERGRLHPSAFAEFLVGGSRFEETLRQPGSYRYDDNGFSMKVGGGLDFDLSPRFAVRAFDADYYRTPFINAHQNNFWLATGFVIRLGSIRPH